MRVPRRRGFTLIEFMAALALASLAVITVALLIRQIDVTRDLVTRTSNREDASANGARLLRDLIERAEMASDSTRQFFGDAQSANVPTWCDTPGGWLERCLVRVALDQRGDSTAVYVHLEDNRQLLLAVFSGSVSLAYLGTVFGGQTWTSMWGRGAVPPTAIGFIRQAGDTMVVRIGDRG